MGNAGSTSVGPSCPTGQIVCNDICTDPQTDQNNCGACGTPCGAGTFCSGGSCQVLCGVGQQNCSGSCRTVASDPANCGACGMACPAGQYCNAGTCSATCDFELCDGAAGLECVKYFGIAGPRGGELKSCEIRCQNPRKDDGCPAGQTCLVIADGPGNVCRPK